MRPNKAYIVSALFIGIVSTVWAAITWVPLALGYQVCQYSEYHQGVAIFEFSGWVIGLTWLLFVIIHSIRAK